MRPPEPNKGATRPARLSVVPPLAPPTVDEAALDTEATPAPSSAPATVPSSVAEVAALTPIAKESKTKAGTPATSRFGSISSSFLGLAVAVLFFAAMAGAALVLANSQATDLLAEQGTVGVQAEAAISAASTTRNRLALTVFLANARAEGQSTDEAVADSAEDVIEGIAALDARLLGLAEVERADELSAARDEFVATADNVLAAIADDDIAQAQAILDESVDSTFSGLGRYLVQIRNEAAASLAVAQDTAGRVGNAARFFVAFFIPLGGVLLYRRGAKRRARQQRLESDLEKQKAVSRTKDEFIANLSHELRTPLTGIQGFSMALLELDASDRDLADEMARLIASESSELARMVEDLLTAARDEQGQLAFKVEPFDPAGEIDQVLKPIELGGEHIDVDLGTGWVLADRLRFRQVARNLVSNARKHGGPTVRIAGRRIDGRYQFDVVDNGEGVTDDEVRERMFERFVHEGEAPLETGSVGLGLAIASLLIHRMDGTLQYIRSDGETVFRVSLPAAKPQTTEVSEAS